MGSLYRLSYATYGSSTSMDYGIFPMAAGRCNVERECFVKNNFITLSLASYISKLAKAEGDRLSKISAEEAKLRKTDYFPRAI